jgi:hypothetical protein
MAELPLSKGEHAMEGCWTHALMCGGSEIYNSKMNFLRDRENSMECWWFTPVPGPVLAWDPLCQYMEKGPVKLPILRARHVVSFDTVAASVILFGGIDQEIKKLDDCLFLDLSQSLQVNPETYT